MTQRIRGSGRCRPSSAAAARSSANFVTPARLYATDRRVISASSSRSTARPYSRSDSTPTARACGSQVRSRRVGTNSAKDTPSLKSSR